MTQGSLLQFDEKSDRLKPYYLNEHDLLWLQTLVELYPGLKGKTRNEILDFMMERLPYTVKKHKLIVAIDVISRKTREKTVKTKGLRELREKVFIEATNTPRPLNKIKLELTKDYSQFRELIFDKISKQVNLSQREIEKLLLFDLDPQMEEKLETNSNTLMLKANSAILSNILRKTLEVRIKLYGNAKEIVRLTKWLGLICNIKASFNNKNEFLLYISGPLALFKKTSLYGNALIRLIPSLMKCENFELTAKTLRNELMTDFIIRKSDPLFVDLKERKFDSSIEKRFFADFIKTTLDYIIIQEPEPISAGDSLLFPDFLIESRWNPKIKFFIEIMGFWTDDYLINKLRKLNAANITNLIICLDENLKCSDNDFPEFTNIIKFKKRVDVVKVIEIINKLSIYN